MAAVCLGQPCLHTYVKTQQKATPLMSMTYFRFSFCKYLLQCCFSHSYAMCHPLFWKCWCSWHSNLSCQPLSWISFISGTQHVVEFASFQLLHLQNRGWTFISEGRTTIQLPVLYVISAMTNSGPVCCNRWCRYQRRRSQWGSSRNLRSRWTPPADHCSASYRFSPGSLDYCFVLPF